MGTMIENGYLALPESGSGPAVIVIQEWWGLVGHITDVVDRFAAAGFVAFYPGASWERHAPQWANFVGKAALRLMTMKELNTHFSMTIAPRSTQSWQQPFRGSEPSNSSRRL